MSLKEKIKKRFGTMRSAAVETGINYYRLSQFVNGWVVLKPDEVKSLGLLPKDLPKRQSSGR